MFSRLTVIPITSRSTAESALPRNAPCKPTKPAIAVGDPPIVPARLGMKPTACSSLASGARAGSGADAAVWMMKSLMPGRMRPPGRPCQFPRREWPDRPGAP